MVRLSRVQCAALKIIFVKIESNITALTARIREINTGYGKYNKTKTKTKTKTKRQHTK
jgi:hypothetical protein